MKLVLIIFLLLISLGNQLMAQCLIPNGDFKNSVHKKGNLWYPSEWSIQGKYIWIYDDNKPYVNKRNGKITYIYGRDLFEPYDTTKKEILSILSKIPKQGRRYKQAASVKLTNTLEKDSLYEISMDVSFKSGNFFSYKYYPVFFTTNQKHNKKNETKVELYNISKALLYDGKWYSIKAQYKAKGTELYFYLKDDLDYPNVLQVIDIKKDNLSDFYKYSIYFDNVCIKKLHE